MTNEHLDEEMMDEMETESRIAPEMKVGLYYCIFMLALATIIYFVC